MIRFLRAALEVWPHACRYERRTLAAFIVFGQLCTWMVALSALRVARAIASLGLPRLGRPLQSLCLALTVFNAGLVMCENRLLLARRKKTWKGSVS